jgi:hypothetical protein
VPYAVPLLVFGAFVVLQKMVTGRFFYIYAFETDALFEFSIGSAARRAAEITRWLFVSQFRWVLTLAIALHLLVSPEARRRRELLLFALVAVASGYVFSVLFYMPRYLLPVLPFFYALGAVSVMGLARGGRRQLAAVATSLGITIWSLATDPYRGHGEDNMRYVGIVRMHQEAAADVSARYSSARILSAWPVAAELGDPLLGFVREPLNVKWFAGPQDLAEADVAVVSDPANAQAAEFLALLRNSGWTAVSARRQGEHSITVYEPPPNAGPAPLPERGPTRE